MKHNRIKVLLRPGCCPDLPKSVRLCEVWFNDVTGWLSGRVDNCL